MNACYKSKRVAFIVCLAVFSLAWLSLNAAVTIKDDIKLIVRASKDENGEIKIHCVLANESSSIVAYNIWANMLERYQISLFDENGMPISQEPEWAEQYGQIGSKAHDKRPTGAVITVYKKPGEKIEESFLLKDAYGDRASKGRKLMLSWWNNWGSDTLNIPTTVDPATGRLRHETVPARYKGDWEISVAMSLNADGEEVFTPPKSESSETHEGRPEEPEIRELSQNTAAQSSGNSAAQPSQIVKPPWWLLGLVLLALLIWRVIRRLKAQRHD